MFQGDLPLCSHSMTACCFGVLFSQAQKDEGNLLT